ncbi:MAG: hypothetical protein JW829_03405, partial [Pirellulales bacterium]|nr:hypothetical protein [Pirellulales bacterium]
MSRIRIPAALLFIGLFFELSFAQDPPEVVELYGNGVHAYFSHQNTKAYDLLTQVIEAGSKDPRAFYFRAMTLLRLGREPEGLLDMQVGATLEAEMTNSAYPVDRSLERIQGRSRRILET